MGARSGGTRNAQVSKYARSDTGVRSGGTRNAQVIGVPDRAMVFDRAYNHHTDESKTIIDPQRNWVLIS